MSVNSRASSYLSWDHQQSVESLTDEFGTKLSLDSKDIYDQRRLYTKASVLTSESSQHHLEHLATFSLSREEGVASVEEAVRKLRLQEARGAVWAQELLLHVDTACLRLLDVSTREVFDQFPFPCVLMARSVRGVDLESSLLTLSVKESTEPYPEIHIFQCEQPHLICEEIDGAISRFSSTMRSRGSARSAAASTSASTHRSIMDTMRLASKSARKRVTRLFDPDDDDPVDVNVDSEEVNHVLGDIEAFVGRLQMAADALQQLAKKRKRRLLSRKRAGDGLLKQRAQFPPEAEFFDILQKFKHGFNLLGRLRDKISDPTSEELVSILFEFLKVVVFHSRGPTGLAPSVVAPLLTSATLSLLTTCLTTENSLLLSAMGDAWGKSRWGSLTHSFIHSFIHTFTHSFIHSLIHSLTHSLTHSFTRSLTHSFIHSIIHSLTHYSLTHSPTHHSPSPSSPRASPLRTRSC
ncbi:epidermal growth factor receptor kinase substrate 8-like [Petromyzon marinus]|uniref:epidermal growth factor receptor kinase substrate 8-like n=1 Tax=Petromyzon marinus TaxID=7757 RepID=UPI003F71971B